MAIKSFYGRLGFEAKSDGIKNRSRRACPYIRVFQHLCGFLFFLREKLDGCEPVIVIRFVRLQFNTFHGDLLDEPQRALLIRRGPYQLPDHPLAGDSDQDLFRRWIRSMCRQRTG